MPLTVEEPQSAAVSTFVREDQFIVVWWMTRVECISALNRKTREGVLDTTEVRNAWGVLDSLTNSWSEIQPSAGLRVAAESFLRRHPLAAGDACQLAAAWRWCRGDPRGREFISLDGTLREAATQEGFSVLPEHFPA